MKEYFPLRNTGILKKKVVRENTMLRLVQNFFPKQAAKHECCSDRSVSTFSLERRKIF